MNLKKFEDLAGKWRLDAAFLRNPPFTEKGINRADVLVYVADSLNKLISDTVDDAPDYDAGGDYCLCDGCGLPIEPTKTFHGDRCIRLYALAHAKAHGKEDEDDD